jgi:hypothetical protein
VLITPRELSVLQLDFFELAGGECIPKLTHEMEVEV